MFGDSFGENEMERRSVLLDGAAGGTDAHSFIDERLLFDYKDMVLQPYRQTHTVEKNTLPPDSGAFILRLLQTEPVEFTFPSGSQSAPLKFTTQVRVVPDLLPSKFVPKGRPQ